MISLVGSVWEKAAFVIQVKASLVRCLHLYPDGTALLRQVVLKTLGTSVSACRGPRCRTCGPSASCLLKSRSTSLSNYSLRRPRNKQPNPLLYSRTEGWTWLPGWGISPTSPLLVHRRCVPSRKHPPFCLLAFDVCCLSSSRMQPVYSKILSSV